MTRKVLSFLNVTRILAVAALAAGAAGGSLLADTPKDGRQSQAQQTAPSTGAQGRGGPQFGDVRDPWWKDPQMVKDLALTPMQVDKINRIYEQRQRAIKPAAEEFERLRMELDRLIKERKAKPSEIEAQARKLTYPHLEIDISRIRMLYEMSLVLTKEQGDKFDRLEQERRDRERGRGPGPRGNSGR